MRLMCNALTYLKMPTSMGGVSCGASKSRFSILMSLHFHLAEMTNARRCAGVYLLRVQFSAISIERGLMEL